VVFDLDDDLKKLKKDDHFTTQCIPSDSRFDFDPENFSKDKEDFDTSKHALSIEKLIEFALECTRIRQKFEERATS
jgi:hypothetical protein